MRLALVFFCLSALLAPAFAPAAERTVSLAVENATCALCGPIIKRTLARLSGVRMVKVDETGPVAIATVTFDDALTGVPALIAATTNAGYPAAEAE